MNDLIDLSALRPSRLAQLSALLVGGPDARAFLQGQLSAEMEELRPDRARLASCNSAQGRVQAVLWLVERLDGVALVLPDSMLESIAVRLRKYVLRSKVRIDPAAGRLAAGVLDRGVLSGAATPTADRSHIEQSGVSLVHLPGHTQILTLANAPDWNDADAGVDRTWRLDHIRAGLPQVYPETHEAFVAQMLNIDALDGISFSKGCYTGQEIIARTHYRGAIKRRMFRFKATCPPPAPGTRIAAGDQHAGDVVDAVATAGGCELLAVVSLAQARRALELETPKGAMLEPQTLPYGW
ncbi:MAG: YgfZ/GcvT domain-containing protein [Steroidobacter sp.]